MKVAESSTKSEEENKSLLAQALDIIKEMTNNAASSAKVINQVASRTRTKQRSRSGSNDEVEASSSSKKITWLVCSMMALASEAKKYSMFLLPSGWYSASACGSGRTTGEVNKDPLSSLRKKNKTKYITIMI